MKTWFVFIESNTSGTGQLFARSAEREGFKPILFAKDPSNYKYASENGIEVLRINTEDKEAMLHACHLLKSESGVAGVTTSSEYFIHAAAILASRLGLPGPQASVIRNCRDKQKQRQCLRAAGCDVPAFFPATTLKGARAIAESMGFPVVVKPVRGSGSVGVKLCRNLTEVSTHATELFRQRRNERGLAVPRRILIEALAKGPEFSVETFGRNVVGITQKYLGPLPDFVEVGHDFPAKISDSARKLIHNSVISALDALGMGWGPAHTELRLCESGPKIIEVNPRLAGGYIPELVRIASGIDLIAETIRLAAGRPSHLTRPLNRCACIRFIIPAGDGVFIGAHGIDEATAVPNVVEARLYRTPGSAFCRKGDFRDRIGHVISCGDNHTDARFSAMKAYSAIRVAMQSN